VLEVTTDLIPGLAPHSIPPRMELKGRDKTVLECIKLACLKKKEN
jgi:hypothetical protein